MRQTVPTYALYGEDNAGLGDFWIHSESIPSRSSVHHWEIRPHRHDAFFQILDIRSGEGELVLPAGPIPIATGALVVVPPGTPHGFRFSPDIDGNVLTFVVSRRPLPQGAAGLGGEPAVIWPDEAHADTRLARELLARINGEVAAGFGISSDFIGACLAAALVLIARISAAGARPDDKDERDNARIERLKTLIALHFREQRPVDFYAGKLAVTPTHLNRVCRKVTGGPVGRLVSDRLLEEARRDLVFTSMTIQQIAFDLGFSDPAYFNRFFSREAGMTPKAYRERERARIAAATA